MLCHQSQIPSSLLRGGIEFAGGGAYCSTKNDGISERKFRHKCSATINFMALITAVNERNYALIY